MVNRHPVGNAQRVECKIIFDRCSETSLLLKVRRLSYFDESNGEIILPPFPN